jgi:hypothetical protein
MTVPKPSSDGRDRLEETREVLATLRRCRSRLNRLQLDHAAVYTDIAVQLLEQAVSTDES